LVLPDYLADVAKEMRARSASIRRDFASHRLSAGENREDLVESFLREHLPQRFGVGSGLVISGAGMFSNQADVLITDAFNNSPLYGSSSNQLWPVESVYSLIEVKTTLNLPEIKDCVAKGRRFKTLNRQFTDAGHGQRIRDSLFVIWAFDCPSTETLKANLEAELSGVPREEQPDFVVVPDRLVVQSGSYLELNLLGQPGSPHRAALQAAHGANLSSLLAQAVRVYDMGENALLAWYVWFDSWLRQAGGRLTTPMAYLPPERIYGRLV
jgi:hypothetical protein